MKYDFTYYVLTSSLFQKENGVITIVKWANKVEGDVTTLPFIQLNCKVTGHRWNPRGEVSHVPSKRIQRTKLSAVKTKCG